MDADRHRSRGARSRALRLLRVTALAALAAAAAATAACKAPPPPLVLPDVAIVAPVNFDSTSPPQIRAGEEPCRVCSGTGQIAGATCHVCRGTGVAAPLKRVEVSKAEARAMFEGEPYKLELIDGVKVLHDDGWVLALPDPEEPVTHIWAEADDQRRAGELAQEYVRRIRQALR